jgi:spore germination cell wall hydrolase CwlJ-like protein
MRDPTPPDASATDVLHLDNAISGAIPGRWHFGALGLVAAVILSVTALAGAAYYSWSKNPNDKDSVTLALQGPPPPVEPMELQKVSMDYARKINASIPFTTFPVPAAKPFKFAGSQTDYSRAIDCLAATVYYEAGNEALEGQKAVVQVVLNRVRHPAFPKTVCGVVFQGQERRTGCQFSFTCDGSIARRRPSPDAWLKAQAIGRAMLDGEVYAPVGTATHYHTDWVLPAWSAKLDKIRAEATHLFFRWVGAWGTPRAFSGQYAGVEGPYGKLAALSSVHAGPVDNGLAGIDLTKDLAKDLGLSIDIATLGKNPATLDLPALERPLPPALIGSSLVSSDTQKGQFILRVDPGIDSSMLSSLAEQTCGLRDYCKVLVWTDPKQTPKTNEPNQAQLQNMAFSYLRDRSKGFEKPLWNCSIFKRGDTIGCMRGRGIQAAARPKLPSAKSPSALQMPDGLRDAAEAEKSND